MNTASGCPATSQGCLLSKKVGGRQEGGGWHLLGGGSDGSGASIMVDSSGVEGGEGGALLGIFGLRLEYNCTAALATGVSDA